MGGFAVYIEDRKSMRRHVMTGETPQKVTSKKVDIKDSLTPEDVEAIIVYVHSLKSNIKPAEAIRQRALRAIDKIRPVHIHNSHRKRLRVHGYKESPHEVKIRFFCPTCGRTESISVPKRGHSGDDEKTSRPEIMNYGQNIVYLPQEEYDSIARHIINLRKNIHDPLTRMRALSIIGKIRPHHQCQGEERPMEISNYKLRANRIAIKFRCKKCHKTRTISIMVAEAGTQIPADKQIEDTSDRTLQHPSVYTLLRQYVSLRKHGKDPKRLEKIKRLVVTIIEKLRPKHCHENRYVMLHIHGYYLTKLKDIVIRFKCPKCGRTESVRIRNPARRRQKKAKKRVVIRLRNPRCIHCNNEVKNNGTARTRIENIRIQQYKCKNPECGRSFRATAVIKKRLTKFMSTIAMYCPRCGREARITFRGKRIIVTCPNCGFGRRFRRKIPTIKDLLPEESLHWTRDAIFILADAVILLFTTEYGLSWRIMDGLGYAARKFRCGLSYSDYVALMRSPAPFLRLKKNISISKIYRQISALDTNIIRSLVQFSGKLARRLLSDIIRLDIESLGIYAVDSSSLVLKASFYPDNSALFEFHIAVSLPFLSISDVIFGPPEYSFDLDYDSFVIVVGDREYAIRGFSGRMIGSGDVPIVMPRGETSEYDILVASSYLFERFRFVYFVRWIVEPLIGYVVQGSNCADSRLLRMAELEVGIRCFLWNVMLIGMALWVLRRRRNRGIFDLLLGQLEGCPDLNTNNTFLVFTRHSNKGKHLFSTCDFSCVIHHPHGVAS